MHPSGILTLSEAALTKRWGSRRTLSRYVRDGLLTPRDIGWASYVTVEALERLKSGSKKPPKA